MHHKLQTRYIFSLMLAISLFTFGLNAQSTLFYENFEGATSGFTLNTSDMLSSPTLDSRWVINNSYDGGPGSAPCGGFMTANFDPVNTPDQNAGVTGNVRSKYMHINSKLAESGGRTNCMYIDPNPFFGLCIQAGNAFSKMTTPISTSGFENVNLSFYWLCLTNSKSFGEVYYSTDNGTTWKIISAPRAKYFNEANWTSQTLTNPAWDNQATLQFGFRFVNQFHGMSDSIIDPAFGLDEIKVTATPTAAATLNQNFVEAGPFCAGATINVPLTSTGSFASGNEYTVELSDASGSFGTPTSIGTITSSSNSASISANIPANTPAGTGYRIRVISTSPVVTSSASAPFTINPAPSEADLTTLQSSVCTGTGTTLTFEGSAGTLKWESSTNGQTFNVINGQTAVEYPTGNLTQDTWYRVTVTNSCGDLVSNVLKVSIESTVVIPASQTPEGEIDLCVTKVTLTIPNGYTNVVWSTGRTGNVINITQPGTYFATGVSPSGCQGRTIDYTYTKSPDPVAGFTYTQPSGYTIEFTNTSQNGVTYYWDFGYNADTSILESPTYNYPFDDTYPVMMIVTNSCGSDTMAIDLEVKKFVGIDELPGIDNVLVYPIPASNKLFVQMNKTDNQPALLTMLDLTGRVIVKEPVKGQGMITHTLSLNHIASGTYLLVIEQGGVKSTQKIQVQ